MNDEEKMHAAAAELSERLAEVLKGNPPQIQGDALAMTGAKWIAGHFVDHKDLKPGSDLATANDHLRTLVTAYFIKRVTQWTQPAVDHLNAIIKEGAGDGDGNA